MRAGVNLACMATVPFLRLMSTTCVGAQFGIHVALLIVGRMENQMSGGRYAIDSQFRVRVEQLVPRAALPQWIWTM